MRKFEVLKTYAELAWAGYKEFKTKDATGAQIGAFDKRFETVKDSPANSSSGFQATLFKDKSTGEYILSVRGTEANIFNDPLEAFKDTIVADGNLALNDMPSSQTRDMMNFINELVYGEKNGDEVITPPKISFNDHITIVGHSLGGTLAQIASKMYPSLFDNCYTFNSPSGNNLNYHKIYKDSDGKYYWLGNEQINFKHYVEDKIGEAFHNYQNTSMTTSVTDVRAKDVLSMIANLWWKERFGERIEVSGTNSNDSIWRVA
ncbi:hypothetical protein [Campylobacter sp. RM16190]|uniref:lipase family protein n=1 Tax=Campylobacter sp. RM16190 TaxID=1705727 RepID=UPI0014727250|nr:hypothetical protein [Campylobacter sp. RM16190]